MTLPLQSGHRQAARVAAAMAAALALGVAAATPSTAHNVLVDSTPSDGATLESQPGSVELVFDQPVQDQEGFTQVAVLDADENTYQVGEPEVDRNVVRHDVDELADGDYTIAYRVVSADGHPVSGTLEFTMAAGSDTAADDDSRDAESEPDPAGEGDEPAAASDDQQPAATGGPDGGVNGAVVAGIVLAAVVAAVAVANLVIRRRRRAQAAGHNTHAGDSPES